jgi:hypothetical protein
MGGTRRGMSVRRRRRQALTAILAGAIVLGACGGDDGEAGSDTSTADEPPEWPAPPDPLERTAAAGLEPTRHELLQNHRHSHLDVFVDGEPVAVPAGIGIDITDPGVRRFPGPAYGGIEECDEPCISPLHTHDDTGIIHTESGSEDLLTLDQLFTEWGVRLDDSCVGDFCTPATPVAVYLDGERYAGDPALVELEDRLEIAIVVGDPPERIPDTADFTRA